MLRCRAIAASVRTYLDVPFLEKDEAKALGARWDPQRRQWWAPADVDPRAFSRWLDPEPREFTGSPVTVRLVQVVERCWKCGTACRPIVGAELAGEWAAYPDGWVDFPDCAEGILATHHPELLDMQDAGPIEWRRTKHVPEGYWGNTCPACRATLGTFPLLEALNDLLSQGTERDELPGWITELPGDVFQPDEEYWAREGLENGWGEEDPAMPAARLLDDPDARGLAPVAPAGEESQGDRRGGRAGFGARLRRCFGRS